MPEHRGSVDFLMPSFSSDGAAVHGEPISYSMAVTRLRFLLLKLGVAAPERYTAHSAKATILAWSAQLGVDTAKRAKQGHRQSDKTVTLNRRDDVFAALQLQEEVVRAIRSGWRPMRAQLRGARPPAEEPEVVLKQGAAEEQGGDQRKNVIHRCKGLGECSRNNPEMGSSG